MSFASTKGGSVMSFETPVIVLLLAANALWYLVGWAKGFNEGKREGLVVAKSFQRVTQDAR
jgi:hypothetical protein